MKSSCRGVESLVEKLSRFELIAVATGMLCFAPQALAVEVCRVTDGASDCYRYVDDCSSGEHVTPQGKSSCGKLEPQRCHSLRSLAKLQLARVRNLREEHPGGFDQRMPASQCPHFYVRADADTYASACVGDDERGADGLFRFFKFTSDLCSSK